MTIMLSLMKPLKKKMLKKISSKKNLRKNLKKNFKKSLGDSKGFIKILRTKYKGNFSQYLGYFTFAVLLGLISSESFAVDLAKFGKGVTEPMVKFAEDYWIYGAGIGGITTALFSDGDGRTRVIRGGTVFLGASAICMGILAAMK